MIKEKLKPEIFVYKAMVPHREEEVPVVAKFRESKVVERVFEQHHSVFGAWKSDNNA